MSSKAGYYDGWEAQMLHCERCGWVGTGTSLQQGELFADLTEFDCPTCHQSVLLVTHPTLEESRANVKKLSPDERKEVERCEQRRRRMEAECLRSDNQLPDITEERFELAWDFDSKSPGGPWTLIRLRDQLVFREPAFWEGYERFIDVARMLRGKYGKKLTDLVPTERSRLYLFGDKLSAPKQVSEARRELFS